MEDKQKLQELIRQIKAKVAQRKTEFLWQYKPLDKPNLPQLAFHQSKARIRLYSGGTGAGKTLLSCAEIACCLTGEAPDWLGVKYPDPPNHVWVVKQKFPEEGTDPVYNKLLRGDEFTDPETGEPVLHGPLIPDRYEPSYNKSRNVLTLNNGSTLQFKTSEQEEGQFASEGIDLIVHDEPCTRGIYNECKFRLFRRQGSRMILAFAPTGKALSYLNEIMKNAESEPEMYGFFTADTRENPHVDQRFVLDLMRNCPKDQIQMRVMGIPRYLTGLVYSEWENWVKPFNVSNPERFTHYVVHDPGIRNPAATLWGAVDGSGNIYLYRCLYDESMNSSIKAVCHDIIKANGDTPVYKWLIDPFAASVRVPTLDDPKNEVTILVMYKHSGIPWKLGPKEDDLAGRRQRINATKLYIDKDTAPSVYAFDTEEMEPLRRELELYRWAENKGPEEKNEPDKPHDKDNHLMYCMETMCALKLKHIANASIKLNPTDNINDMNRQLWQGLTTVADTEQQRVRL